MRFFIVLVSSLILFSNASYSCVGAVDLGDKETLEIIEDTVFIGDLKIIKIEPFHWFWENPPSEGVATVRIVNTLKKSSAIKKDEIKVYYKDLGGCQRIPITNGKSVGDILKNDVLVIKDGKVQFADWREASAISYYLKRHGGSLEFKKDVE